ncbi:MAG TPA: hypothetical protein VKU00_15200 [Chthonomonadaceae bacterium]|nr:hypothetical protein [Chthonomonadaceae bacterium]
MQISHVGMLALQRKGKSLFGVGLLGLFTLLSGCAREVATTTVKPDGSWTRQVVIHTPKMDMNAPPGPAGPFALKPEDVFDLPAGPNWKITKSEKDSDAIYTAERTVPLGAAVDGDIAIKRSNAKSVAVVNQVTVKQVAPGKFVYTETFTWKGEKPKELLTPEPDEIAAIKEALPDKLATDANVKALAEQFNHVYWRILFGPGSPLISNFSQIMAEPEVVEHRIMKQTGPNLERILTDKFADQLTAEQRHSVAHKIMHGILDMSSKKQHNPNPGGNDIPGDVPPVALSIFLKMPGKITQSNGEADSDAGEVIWSLYPQAAALGDVTLTATCETK